MIAGAIAALIVYVVGNELFETVEKGNLLALLAGLLAGVAVFLAVNGTGWRRRDRV